MYQPFCLRWLKTVSIVARQTMMFLRMSTGYYNTFGRVKTVDNYSSSSLVALANPSDTERCSNFHTSSTKTSWIGVLLSSRNASATLLAFTYLTMVYSLGVSGIATLYPTPPLLCIGHFCIFALLWTRSVG